VVRVVNPVVQLRVLAGIRVAVVAVRRLSRRAVVAGALLLVKRVRVALQAVVVLALTRRSPERPDFMGAVAVDPVKEPIRQEAAETVEEVPVVRALLPAARLLRTKAEEVAEVAIALPAA